MRTGKGPAVGNTGGSESAHVIKNTRGHSALRPYGRDRNLILGLPGRVFTLRLAPISTPRGKHPRLGERGFGGGLPASGRFHGDNHSNLRRVLCSFYRMVIAISVRARQIGHPGWRESRRDGHGWLCLSAPPRPTLPGGAELFYFADFVSVGVEAPRRLDPFPIPPGAVWMMTASRTIHLSRIWRTSFLLFTNQCLPGPSA